MPQIETPYGKFVVSRRAHCAFSVVQATRACRHHAKWLSIGEYTIVEHRKLPLFREHVGMGWCKHIATYGLDGNEIQLRGYGK